MRGTGRIGYRSRGFSLVEMLLVIVVIGLLSGVSYKSIKYITVWYTFNNAEKAVKQMLLTARSVALANPNVHCGIHVDTTTNPRTVLIFRDNSSPTSYQYDSGLDSIYQHVYSIPTNVSISILSSSHTDIIFRGDGSAYNSDSLSVSIKTSNVTFKDTISILASTGRIKIY